MRTLLLAALLTIGAIAFATGAAAQEWEFQNPLPSGAHFMGLWGSSANDVIAVGFSGAILRWDGSAWRSEQACQPYNLYEVWGTGADDVFAVGLDDYSWDSVIVHWDGTGWNTMNVNACEQLHGVFGFAPDDVYAVGAHSYGRAGVLHWNGLVWSEMPVPQVDQLEGVWGSAPDHVFAVGGGIFPDEAAILFWNGAVWTAMASPVPKRLSSVWGRGPNEVYASGEGGTVLRWDGTVWTAMTTGTSADLNQVWGDENDVFIAGYNRSNGSGEVLRYDGSAWRLDVRTSGRPLFSLWGDSQGNYFAGGTNGGCYQRRAGEWNALCSGDLTNVIGIWTGADGRGYAVCANSYGDSTVLFGNGASWAPIYTTTIQLTAVWAAGLDDVYITGNYTVYVYPYGDVYHGVVLHYDGTDWNILVDLTYQFFHAIFGLGPDDVYIGGGPNSFYHWNGIQLAQMEGTAEGMVYGIHMLSPDEGFAAGAAGSLSHWDGTAWTPMASPTTLTVNGIWAAASDAAYAAVSSGLLKWDGASWTELLSEDAFWVESVWGFGRDDIYGFGYVQSQGPLPQGAVMLHWDGERLTESCAGTGAFIHCAWSGAPDQLFIGGDYGNILKMNPTAPSPTPTAAPTLPPTPTEPPQPTGEPTPPATPVPTGTAVPEPTASPAPEPTRTPISTELPATRTPGPTPPPALGVQLELPAEWITPGDVFYVRGWLVNPTSEALKDTPVCFVLQVVSDYYFWPNWTRLDPIGQTGLDYQEHDVAPGMTKVDVLPAMTWPDTGRQSLAGLMFYGAMLTPDMSALLGNLGQREWGYGPR